MNEVRTKRLLKALWIKACRHDNIPIDSKFVVFSNDNPHIARQNKVFAGN